MTTIAAINIDSARLDRLLADRRRRVTPFHEHFATKFAAQRSLLFAEAFKSHATDPLPLRWAHAVAHVLAHIDIAILPDEVIVGEPVPLSPDSESVAAVKAYLGAAREEHIRLLDSYELDPLYSSIGLAYGWHARVAHNILPYADILAQGIGGMRRQAMASLAALPAQPQRGPAGRHVFYQAAIVALEGLSGFALRYAALARDVALDVMPDRAAELRQVADVCEHIADQPPRNLWEALQLVWFLNVGCKLEDGEVGHSFGRLDQYLYPYYQGDIASGITADQLLNLLTAFWIKINSESQDVCHLTLGGVTPDGADATNPLSYACLAAERRVCLTQPNLSARVHPNTPLLFWQAMAATIRRGAGHPAVFNDAVTVPGLMDLGVSGDVARDYAKVGCIETFLPGRSLPWFDSYVNSAKCLELTLTGGSCLVTGRRAGLPGSGAAGIASFDDLVAAYYRQVRFVAQLVLKAKADYDLILPRFQAAPLQSALTPSCVLRGRDIYDGGTDYHLTGCYLVGMATTIDSLAAIRQVVFEDKVLTLSELVSVLRVNFAGHESLRQRLLNHAPKFGNDDDRVDRLAPPLVEAFSRAVVEAPSPKGWLKLPMIGSVSAHAGMGRHTGATADGRLLGDSLSDGGSPAQGRSIKGPTAALRSVTKANHRLIPGGEAVNLLLSPSALSGDSGLRNLVSLLKGYVELGGEQLQVNVVDRATLQDAVLHPQSYRHLVVRVAGYCAYFTGLDPLLQREIMARTEHSF